MKKNRKLPPGYKQGRENKKNNWRYSYREPNPRDNSLNRRRTLEEIEQRKNDMMRSTLMQLAVPEIPELRTEMHYMSQPPEPRHVIEDIDDRVIGHINTGGKNSVLMQSILIASIFGSMPHMAAGIRAVREKEQEDRELIHKNDTQELMERVISYQDRAIMQEMIDDQLFRRLGGYHHGEEERGS